MKQAVVLGLAIALTLGLAVSTAQAGKKVKKRKHGEVKKIIVCKPVVFAYEFSPF